VYRWRVTKYDPARRDRQGRLRDETWTSSSDIGRQLEGDALTVTEYLAVEDAYVAAVRAFHRAAGEPLLTVTGLEVREPARRPSPLPSVESRELHDEATVQSHELDALTRLVLREEMWCELRHAADFRIRFGWDLYMYVTSSAPSSEAIAEAEARRLFVEPVGAIPGEGP
jgi:hypothetical protein